MNTLAPVGGADLQALTREINLLDRTRDDHLYQLGMKLIPIRQIVQQMNGARRGGRAPDGLCPRGWPEWCQSAGIPLSTAGKAVRRAVDPMGDRQKRTAGHIDSRLRHSSFNRQLKRVWPNWTEAQQQSVIDTIVELARGA